MAEIIQMVSFDTTSIQKGLTETTEDVVNLRSELKNCKLALANMEEGTDDYNKKLHEAAEMNQRLADINEYIAGSANDAGQAISNLGGVAAGVVGSISALEGGLTLLGVNSDSVGKSLQHLQSLSNITSGLAALESSRDSFEKLTNQIKSSEIWQRIFNKTQKKATTEAVANTVATTAQAKSQNMLKRAVKGVGGAFKKLGKAMKSSGAIMIAIAVIIEGISWLVDKCTDKSIIPLKDAITDANGELNDFASALDATKNAAEELKELQNTATIYSTLGSAARGTKNHIDALNKSIKDLNDGVGKGGQWDKLKKDTDDLVNSYKKFADQLKNEKQAILNSGYEKNLAQSEKNLQHLIKLEQELSEIEEDDYEARRAKTKEVNAAREQYEKLQKTVAAQKKQLDNVNAAEEQNAADLKEAEAAQKALNEAREDAVKVLEEIRKEYKRMDHSELQQKLDSELDKFEDKKDKIKALYDSNIITVKEYNNAIANAQAIFNHNTNNILDDILKGTNSIFEGISGGSELGSDIEITTNLLADMRKAVADVKDEMDVFSDMTDFDLNKSLEIMLDGTAGTIEEWQKKIEEQIIKDNTESIIKERKEKEVQLEQATADAKEAINIKYKDDKKKRDEELKKLEDNSAAARKRLIKKAEQEIADIRVNAAEMAEEKVKKIIDDSTKEQDDEYAKRIKNIKKTLDKEIDKLDPKDSVNASKMRIAAIDEEIAAIDKLIAAYKAAGKDYSELNEKRNALDKERIQLLNEVTMGELATFQEAARVTLSEIQNILDMPVHGLGESFTEVGSVAVSGLMNVMDSLGSLNEMGDSTKDKFQKIGKVVAASGEAAANVLFALAEQQDASTKKGFETRKAYEISGAVIGGLVGILNAWISAMSPANSWMTGPGQIALGASMSALIATMMGLQIAAIAKVKPGQASTGSAPSTSALMAMGKAPDPHHQVKGASEKGKVPDTKVFVLEEDISKSQNNVKTTVDEATI